MVKLPEPGNTPVLPTGTYLIKHMSWEKTKASTGTEQILWKSEVQEGDQAGRTLTTYTALTAAAIWKVGNLIGAAGIKYDPNAIDTDSAEFTQLCNMTNGRTAYWLNVEGTDNKGIPRNNVAKFESDPDQEPIEFTITDDSPFADESPFVE